MNDASVPERGQGAKPGQALGGEPEATVEPRETRAPKTGDLRVVKASARRLDSIRELWLLIHRQHLALGDPRRGPARSEEESWQLKRAQYAEWLPEANAFLLIVEHDGEPLGYTVVQVRSYPPNPDWHSPERKAWIEDLSVRPEAQRLGVGKLLIDAIKTEAQARNLPALGGEALAVNEDAIRFYEREGGYRTATLIEYQFAHEPGIWEKVHIEDESGEADERWMSEAKH